MVGCTGIGGRSADAVLVSDSSDGRMGSIQRAGRSYSLRVRVRMQGKIATVCARDAGYKMSRDSRVSACVLMNKHSLPPAIASTQPIVYHRAMPSRMSAAMMSAAVRERKCIQVRELACHKWHKKEEKDRLRRSSVPAMEMPEARDQ